MRLVVPAADLDPAVTFGCGQTFRFHQKEGAWEGTAYGEKLCVRQDGQNTVIETGGCLPESHWRQYFDLDTEYSSLFPEADPALAAALAYGRGLRVLNQEAFETLISFIISANNNIGRISGIVERISGKWGKQKGSVRAFPDADSLCEATEEELRAAGCGYRAPYVLASAERARSCDMERLKALTYSEAVSELRHFAGVGPKVADCIALYSLGKREAFPVDVWVSRLMRQLYGVTGSKGEIGERARSMFGKNAGIAQQYLFHYARSHLDKGS